MKNQETVIEALIDQAINSIKSGRKDLEYANIDLTMAENNLYKIGQSLMTINPRTKQRRQFEPNDIYHNLIYYFTNHLNCPYDISKGLFIHGRTGTGKSLMSVVFNIFNGVYNPKKNFKLIDSSEIPMAFEMGGMSRVYYLAGGNCLIDDFGNEIMEAVYYGTKANPMKEFLTKRYKMYIQEGKFTHIISNFTMDYVKEMYGDRIESRFCEMFNDIVLDGKDLRK